MRKLTLSVLKIYQYTLSPLFKIIFKGGCRYYPTCSEYAKEAVVRRGAIKGLWLSIKRVSRCHPYGPFGVDPVPES